MGKIDSDLKRFGYTIDKKITSTKTLVFRATEFETGNKVAIKVVDKKMFISRREFKWLERERHSCKNLHHPNIIQLYVIFVTEDKVYFVMEEATEGDLYDRKQEGLSDEKIRTYFRDIVAALQYMHNNGFVHRDLKLENVLIHNGVAKLTDLEFSRQFEEGELSKTYIGTAGYMPPELLKKTPYDMPAADIFSLGCVLHGMIYGCYPYKEHRGVGEEQVLRMMKNMDIDCTEGVKEDPQVKSLREAMLHPDPLKRPTIDEIAVHAWVKNARPKGFKQPTSLEYNTLPVHQAETESNGAGGVMKKKSDGNSKSQAAGTSKKQASSDPYYDAKDRLDRHAEDSDYEDCQ